MSRFREQEIKNILNEFPEGVIDVVISEDEIRMWYEQVIDTKWQQYEMKEIPVDFIRGVNGLWYETAVERSLRWKAEEQRKKQRRFVKKLARNGVLTPRQSMAVLLRLKGLTLKEIAEVMEVTPKTVWEHLYGRKGERGGAVRKIQKYLKQMKN